ncbi:MAG: Ferric siderophore transport system, periplasmic binding protein TonB [uncultured Caballeronia sp.]|nr:MAG: Ferric siderophore transport system, periplasmic binding protein TonB [uncultured Caballeronia sp.]
MKFVVGLTGKIENIELKKSSGSSRLDGAAHGCHARERMQAL